MIEKIFILGLPGSGKSTISRAIAASDIISDRSYKSNFSELRSYYKLFLTAEKELTQKDQFTLCHEFAHFAFHNLEFTNKYSSIFSLIKIYKRIFDIVRNYLLSLLRDCINQVKWQLKRLVDIAYRTYNRLAHSPNPQKMEPPTGGVKIGGKQHDIPVMLLRFSTINQSLFFIRRQYPD